MNFEKAKFQGVERLISSNYRVDMEFMRIGTVVAKKVVTSQEETLTQTGTI